MRQPDRIAMPFPRCGVKLILTVAVACLQSAGPVCAAQDEAPQSSLKDDALAISGRYARFERLLSQMADMLDVEAPERAELLRRAISQSRERAIGTNIEAIAKLLSEDSLGDAIEKQEVSAEAMAALLKLLQSEDRRSAVERERERLNDILRNVRDTIAQQRAARAATQNATAPSNAAPDQQKALDRAEQIVDGIQEHDEARSGAAEVSDEKNDGAASEDESQKENAKDKDGKSETPGDKQEPGKEAPSEAGDKSPEGSPSESKSEAEDKPEKSQESPSGKSQKPQDGQSGESQKQSSSGGQSQSPPPGDQDSKQQEQTPGREPLEAAKNLMQEALDQLQQQERDKAVENQDEAIAELQSAAEELEEQLRQLREEEKEMVLAALEARFQRMLSIQTQIHETTVDLAATPRKEWLDAAVSECRELAQQQAELTQECSQTTGLLREDGTSVSILVAVEDIESDMGSVAERLQQTKVGSLTQSMETDVIEALKELIEATQREMEEMKSEQQQQQQQQQNGNEKKQPLVELMAEIRVLRSLQLRVNRRTKQVNVLLTEGDPEEVTDLEAQLVELASRQDRLRESAGELAQKLEEKQ